ncbi:yippee-domain-containing protein [Cadophora sp. DSE1049]|nr:yippee-domain-containing protein [Cadophora sp. DSE1049]
MSPPDTRPPFPTYLLPSFNFPFRRRQSSTTSTALPSSSPPSLSYSPTSSASTSPSSSPPNTHFLPKEILHSALENIPKKPDAIRDGGIRLHRAQPNTLKCVTCSSDIAFADQIVSKGFTGRHGRAYLVSLPPPPRKNSEKDKDKDTSMLPNTKIGRSVNRELLTGQHVVADVSCVICSAVLGWKYLDAKEAAQKYKIGKYILEMKRVVLAVGWEDGVEEGEEVGGAFDEAGGLKEGEDEDEDVVVFDSEDEDECEDLFAGTWDPEVVAKRRGKRTWSRKKNSVEV